MSESKRTTQDVLDEFMATLDEIRAQLDTISECRDDDLDELREALGMDRKNKTQDENRGGRNEQKTQ